MVIRISLGASVPSVGCTVLAASGVMVKVTGVALGVLGVLAALVFWPSHGLDTLDQPEQSLERVVASGTNSC
jgi:hypothetical protein